MDKNQQKIYDESCCVAACERLGIKPYKTAYYPSEAAPVLNLDNPRTITQYAYRLRKEGMSAPIYIRGMRQDSSGWWFFTWPALVHAYNTKFRLG